MKAFKAKWTMPNIIGLKPIIVGCDKVVYPVMRKREVSVVRENFAYLHVFIITFKATKLADMLRIKFLYSFNFFLIFLFLDGRKFIIKSFIFIM